MKLLKEHPILGVCLFLYLVVVALILNPQQAVSLSDYQETQEIVIKDGANEQESYYLHVSTVENVLSDLNITLNEEDSLNFDLTHELDQTETIEITRVTYEEAREQVPVAYVTEYVESSDSSLAGNRLVNEGVNGVKDIIYNVKKVNGKEVSREEIGTEVTTEPINRTIEYGTVTTGYTFSGKLTSYGADCVGCGTRTAAGLYVTTNGVKNQRTATLSYNGGEYYVLAADPQFPFGTIVKISNHSYDLPDPLYGIVLDRGGAVKGTTMDIFSGSQASPLFAGHGSTVNYEIIQYGSGRTSIY